MAALSRLSRGPSRGGRGVSFARRSNRGVSQGGRQGKTKPGQGKPEDYMSKAKQLWTYVGKVGSQVLGSNPTVRDIQLQ